jgi:hypothetical protein
VGGGELSSCGIVWCECSGIYLDVESSSILICEGDRVVASYVTEPCCGGARVVDPERDVVRHSVTVSVTMTGSGVGGPPCDKRRSPLMAFGGQKLKEQKSENSISWICLHLVSCFVWASYSVHRVNGTEQRRQSRREIVRSRG